MISINELAEKLAIAFCNYLIPGVESVLKKHLTLEVMKRLQAITSLTGDNTLELRTDAGIYVRFSVNLRGKPDYWLRIEIFTESTYLYVASISMHIASRELKIYA